jgi:hypothetical protein
MICYIFIKFTYKNVFFNFFKVNKKNKKLEPLLIKTSQFFLLKKTTVQKDNEMLGFLTNEICEFLQVCKINKVYLIFKNFGFQLKHRLNKVSINFEMNNLRNIIIVSFNKYNIPIAGIFDYSTVAYNGCKTKKKRRRRTVRHFRPLKIYEVFKKN